MNERILVVSNARLGTLVVDDDLFDALEPILRDENNDTNAAVSAQLRALFVGRVGVELLLSVDDWMRALSDGSSIPVVGGQRFRVKDVQVDTLRFLALGACLVEFLVDGPSALPVTSLPLPLMGVYPDFLWRSVDPVAKERRLRTILDERKLAHVEQCIDATAFSYRVASMLALPVARKYALLICNTIARLDALIAALGAPGDVLCRGCGAIVARLDDRIAMSRRGQRVAMTSHVNRFGAAHDLVRAHNDRVFRAYVLFVP